TMGTITLGSGDSVIETPVGGGGTLVLTANSLARTSGSGATVDFIGPAVGTTQKVQFINAPALTPGGILAYATVNVGTTNANFATHGGNNQPILANTVFVTSFAAVASVN